MISLEDWYIARIEEAMGYTLLCNAQPHIYALEREEEEECILIWDAVRVWIERGAWDILAEILDTTCEALANEYLDYKRGAV